MYNKNGRLMIETSMSQSMHDISLALVRVVFLLNVILSYIRLWYEIKHDRIVVHIALHEVIHLKTFQWVDL